LKLGKNNHQQQENPKPKQHFVKDIVWIKLYKLTRVLLWKNRPFAENSKRLCVTLYKRASWILRVHAGISDGLKFDQTSDLRTVTVTREVSIASDDIEFEYLPDENSNWVSVRVYAVKLPSYPHKVLNFGRY
jgi:hypothetical protein